MLEESQIKKIVEAGLLAADGPLTVAQIGQLFGADELDEENSSKQVREAIQALQTDSAERGVELKRVASGYRYQVRQELSGWVSRLWDEKPPRYTRALLETLALIAYKQPVTRGDIEHVRGVSVSQSIMRTLLERDWIKAVGQREVPGRPALYGTTKAFLDYFNLKSIDELPPLPEIRQLIEPVLAQEIAAGAESSTQSADEVAADQAEGLEVVEQVEQESEAERAEGKEALAIAAEAVDKETATVGGLDIGGLDTGAVDIQAVDIETAGIETETETGSIEVGSIELASNETAEVVPLHPSVKPV